MPAAESNLRSDYDVGVLILGLDTSHVAATALVRLNSDVELLASGRGSGPRRHVEDLTPLIAQVLPEGQVPDAVAVGTGPAAFTGLRVGVVTARALARGWQIPVCGVPSLEVLAAQYFTAQPGQERVTVVTDARRREVFCATYTRAADSAPPQLLGQMQVGPATGVPTDAPLATTNPELLTQTGLHGELPAADVEQLELDPALLAALAGWYLQRNQAGSTDPIYLRRPDIHGAP